jgi:hypothetical protein
MRHLVAQCAAVGGAVQRCGGDGGIRGAETSDKRLLLASVRLFLTAYITVICEPLHFCCGHTNVAGFGPDEHDTLPMNAPWDSYPLISMR